MCVLGENVEIRVFRPKDTKTWEIYAQYRGGPEVEIKPFLGRSAKLSGVWFHLASFADDQNAEVEIGRAMQTIADAYSQSARVCDLSQVGSTEAGRRDREGWAFVRWP